MTLSAELNSKACPPLPPCALIITILKHYSTLSAMSVSPCVCSLDECALLVPAQNANRTLCVPIRDHSKLSGAAVTSHQSKRQLLLFNLASVLSVSSFWLLAVRGLGPCAGGGRARCNDHATQHRCKLSAAAAHVHALQCVYHAL